MFSRHAWADHISDESRQRGVYEGIRSLIGERWGFDSYKIITPGPDCSHIARFNADVEMRADVFSLGIEWLKQWLPYFSFMPGSMFHQIIRFRLLPVLVYLSVIPD